MNLETIKTLVRECLGSTIVVLLVLGGGGTYVWQEYKELLKGKEDLATARQSFFEERIVSEKNRADMAIDLVARKTELDKREFVLQQLEGQNKEGLAALQQRDAEYQVAFDKLQLAQSSVSQAQRTKDAEEKIQKLMSEFSAMGVNLNDVLPCEDADARKRFNTAKTKYNEIYTLAEAFNLTHRFNNFFSANRQSTYGTCTIANS